MTKFKSLDELLRSQFLIQEEEAFKKRDNNYWYASELGTCLRKQFLRRLGLKTKEKQWRITFTAEQGKAIHKWITDTLQRTGRLITVEESLIDEDLKYKGRLDAIVNLGLINDPYLTLIDIKTQRSEAFFRRKKDHPSLKVRDFQKKQLGSYFFFARRKYPDLKDARLYYLDRGGGLRDEFVFKFKPEMFKEILDELNNLNGYWKRKEIPSCNHGWECKEMCDIYKKECEMFKKGEMSIEELVQKFGGLK